MDGWMHRGWRNTGKRDVGWLDGGTDGGVEGCPSAWTSNVYRLPSNILESSASPQSILSAVFQTAMCAKLTDNHSRGRMSTSCYHCQSLT